MTLFRALDSRTVRFGAAALLATFLAGCGGKTYEGRLEESAKYFKFIEKQNVNLSKPWNGSGLSMRVPLQYQLLPPPKVVKDKQGKIVSTGEDTRQPDFMGGVKLPGLVAAWKADYLIERQKVPGYLYILSNFDLWLETERPKDSAEKFHAFAVRAITDGLKVPPPKDDKWVTEKFPNPAKDEDKYVDEKAYTVAVLNPQPEIHDRKYDGTIYLAKTGDIQVVMLALTPVGAVKEASNSFQIVGPNDRMGLALATFTNAGKKPVKGRAGGADPASKPAF